MTEAILKNLPNALPHCMFIMEIRNRKVTVFLVTNKGNYETDHQEIGVFLNVSFIDVFNSSGSFIASVKEGNVSGIAKTNRCGLKLEVWLSEDCYLFH